tara:strand:- start:228 stop:560 length:333 start_codon:yes stop_codon:yes gene_type:complete
MFCLTPQERKVLLFIGILILVGSFVKFLNKIPQSVEPSKIISQKILIDVNQDSQKDLEKLPGVGGAIAQRIISYREQSGPFLSVEDLKKVKGIGDKKIQSIKDKVTFSDK